MLTSEEEFQFWEKTEVRGSQILGNSVDVPTIHSADPLIFLLPNYFVGGFMVLMRDDFFLLQTGPFLMNFFI
jgi:hypothetical protein